MNYRPQGFQFLPPVIKNLLIINGLMFLGSNVLGQTMGINFNHLLALFFPASAQFMPHQLVTHMFMHGSISHIFFNMFALWMFGTALENLWGGKRFLIYYMITGFGAAMLHMGVNAFEYFNLLGQLDADQISLIKDEGYGIIQKNMNYTEPAMAAYNALINIPVLGASGAVFGILLAFGMTFPEQRIYLYFLLPIKAKWFVLIYGALELWNGVVNTNDGVAHFAHLGGMVFGYFLIKHWQNNQFRQW